MKQKISVPHLAFCLSALLVVISYVPPWLNYDFSKVLSYSDQIRLLYFPVLPCLLFATFYLFRGKWNLPGTAAAEGCLLVAAALPFCYLGSFIHKAFYELHYSEGYMNTALISRLSQIGLALFAPLVLLTAWHSLCILRYKRKPIAGRPFSQHVLLFLRVLLAVVLLVLLILLLLSCKEIWFHLDPKLTPPTRGLRILPGLLFFSVFLILLTARGCYKQIDSPIFVLISTGGAAMLPVILADLLIRYEVYHNISGELHLALAFLAVRPAYWHSLILALLCLMVALVCCFLQCIRFQKPEQ